MAQGSRICKNFTLSVGPEDLTGKVKSVLRPNINNEVEVYRPGGALGQIPRETGIQQIDFEFTVFDVNPYLMTLSGLSEGNDVTFVLREYVQSEDGKESICYHSGTGMVTEENMGTSENGASLGEYSYKMILTRYKVLFDGQPIKDIDVRKNIRVVGLLDQAQNARRILQQNPFA